MRARLVFVTALLLGAASAGCFDVLSDNKAFEQGTGAGSGTGGTGGEGGNGGTTNTGGAGGATTTSPTTKPPDPKCVPSETETPVEDGCGTFVSPLGDDATGTGKKNSPYATISRALKDEEHIYVCTGSGQPYEEAVIVDKPGVFIYGGLGCEKWEHDKNSKTVLTAKAGEIPLRVAASSTVHVEDFVLSARDAPPLQAGVFATGNSSVAIWSEEKSVLELTRCEVNAGRGSDGANGEAPPAQVPGIPGKNGDGGCDSGQSELPGDGGENLCDGMNVSGGTGGLGKTSAISGDDGTPGKPSDGPTGKGGLGQADGIDCTIGAAGPGKQGTLGGVGLGATESALGSLSAEGFVGARGADGMPGTPGQGGGGGGGGRKCQNNMAGPGGGGGGAGGCGGIGGRGGYSGGASIGIVFLGANPAMNLKLSEVIIRTADGGVGGLGAIGQVGGAGGVGGQPGAGDAAAIACPGAAGGKGGDGGKGGAGRGGHSIGIAYVEDAEIDVSKVSFELGTPGKGGTDVSFPAASGAAGAAADTQLFQ